jgi:hypothetical protein
MKTPVGLTPKHYRRHCKQSGQAIVLILMLTLAGLVGAVALYSTGILTSEKMQLQNAADASAYSVSVVEARDLNFTAYMNRAMVGNEVAIGQMVSMMSWANMTRSTPEFISNWAGIIDLIICPVSLGTSCSSVSGAVRPVVNPLRTVSSKVWTVVDKFTKPVANGLSKYNELLSVAQKLFHLLNFIFSASTLFEIKDLNSDGAEFSKFGAIALARHFTSYYAGLMDGLPLYGFVQSYSPGNAGDKTGVGRLAQVINDSRDGFTKNRKCDLDISSPKPPNIVTPEINLGIFVIKKTTTSFTPPGVKCNEFSDVGFDGGWFATLFGLDFSFGARGDIGFVAGEVDGSIGFTTGINRLGGTDLRQDDDNNFTWSAGDTTAPEIQIRFSLKFCADAVFGLVDLGCETLSINVPLPLPPFGAGAAYAGTQPNGGLDISGIPYDGEPQRDIMYGSASRNLLAWDTILFPIPNPAAGWFPTPAAIKHIKTVGQQLDASDRQLSASYNLRRYQDTEDKPAISTRVPSGDWISGLEAPYLLIGLIKEDVVKDSQMSSGVFELDAPETANGSFVLGDTVPFGVIAKSEVYYTRPSDSGAKWFRRSDFGGRNAFQEKPNAFNPFWQARLVDTSYIDRNAALTFQHGQLTLPTEAVALLESFKRLLEKLI